MKNKKENEIYYFITDRRKLSVDEFIKLEQIAIFEETLSQNTLFDIIKIDNYKEIYVSLN